MVVNVHRNNQAYSGRGEEGKGNGGVCGGGGRLYTYRYARGRGMEVGGGGEEGDSIPIVTLAATTRMTSAFRWAAMRAILMFHNCEGQSHETVSTDHNS